MTIQKWKFRVHSAGKKKNNKNKTRFSEKISYLEYFVIVIQRKKLVVFFLRKKQNGWSEVERGDITHAKKYQKVEMSGGR